MLSCVEKIYKSVAFLQNVRSMDTSAGAVGIPNASKKPTVTVGAPAAVTTTTRLAHISAITNTNVSPHNTLK